MQIFHPISVWEHWLVAGLRVLTEDLCRFSACSSSSEETSRLVFRYESRWDRFCSAQDAEPAPETAVLLLQLPTVFFVLIGQKQLRWAAFLSLFWIFHPHLFSLSCCFYLHCLYVSLFLFDIHPFVRLYLLLIFSISFCQSSSFCLSFSCSFVFKSTYTQSGLCFPSPEEVFSVSTQVIWEWAGGCYLWLVEKGELGELGELEGRRRRSRQRDEEEEEEWGRKWEWMEIKEER